MTDASDFLAAICAAPVDDKPRLVFADWLDERADSVKCRACGGACQMRKVVPLTAEEFATRTPPRWESVDCSFCNATGWVSNGYAERAEFIRVQIEMAEGFDPCNCYEFGSEDPRTPVRLRNCESHQRLFALRPRQRELFQWQPESLKCPVVAGQEFALFEKLDTWRRGFPAVATFDTLEEFAERFLLLRAAAPIEEVRLGQWPSYSTTRASGSDVYVVRLDGLDLPDDSPTTITAHEVVLAHGYAEMRRLIGDAVHRLLARNWPGLCFVLPTRVTEEVNNAVVTLTLDEPVEAGQMIGYDPETGRNRPYPHANFDPIITPDQ